MRTSILFLCLCCLSSLHAQRILTLEDAIGMALKNNYDIQIARNEADIARINNTRGNAGMLPQIGINGSGNYAYNKAYRKSEGGSEAHYPNQNSTTLSANVELNWTLFDGGKMFITKQKLEQMQSLGEIQFRAKVLETMFNVISAYYSIVQQIQQLKSLNEVINYNTQRLTIAETGYRAGSQAKTEMLQSKIDLNVAREEAIKQRYAITEAKKNLQVLLGLKELEAFEVSESIPLDYIPDKASLFQKLNASNISLMAFQKQIEIARLTLNENRRAYSPTFNVKGGYYATKTYNSEGSTLQSSTYGPGITGTVSIPLYTAGENKRKIAAAKLELSTAEYNLENARLEANAELENTLNDFNNQQELLHIERENNNLTKENLEISLQRLRLGQTNVLEVHLAQENYVQSSTRLSTFEYNLKLAETKLRQLVADL